LSTTASRLLLAPLGLWLSCAPLQASGRLANAPPATASAQPAQTADSAQTAQTAQSAQSAQSPQSAQTAQTAQSAQSAQSAPPGKGLVLTPEQLTAVGVVVGHAPAGKGFDPSIAFGEVIDPETLFTDLGDAEEAEEADHASLRELERTRALVADGDAAPRMLEAIEAERVKSHARARAAAARVASRWGPLVRLGSGERDRILAGLGSGAGLLLRADVIGQQSIATPPRAALIDVDGVQVSARVLGVLSHRAQPQSAALLIAVAAAPPGFGAGARVPVTLVTAPLTGRLLPREAIFYDERGAFVFQRTSEPAPAALPGASAQRAGTPGPAASAFRTARIKLLGRVGDQSLVAGLDDDDEVVMRGGGALWSMLEIGGHVANGDDDDDDD
jgi:hypothetical protein